MAYDDIKPGGGDTGASRNLQKRVALIQGAMDVRGKKVIDCGCGSGQYLMALHGLGADVYGIEYDEEKVAQFQRQHPELAERVRAGDIEQMSFESDSFDLVLLNEVLEHVPHESKALLEIHRVLKQGGMLVVFSPNRLYPFETHSVTMRTSGRAFPIYVPFIPYIPLGLGDRVFAYHARNYWPSELRGQITRAGFSIMRTGYVWQTFENISGSQPSVVTMIRPFLRGLFTLLEQIPGIRAFGVSQMIVAQKGNRDLQ